MEKYNSRKLELTGQTSIWKIVEKVIRKHGEYIDGKIEKFVFLLVKLLIHQPCFLHRQKFQIRRNFVKFCQIFQRVTYFSRFEGNITSVLRLLSGVHTLNFSGINLWAVDWETKNFQYSCEAFKIHKEIHSFWFDFFAMCSKRLQLSLKGRLCRSTRVEQSDRRRSAEKTLLAQREAYKCSGKRFLGEWNF